MLQGRAGNQRKELDRLLERLGPLGVTRHAVLGDPALLDLGIIGLLLQWKLEPRAVFVLAALNPVEDARLALLSGIEPSLATLGPVGFFLVHRLGGAAMFAIGVLWPVAVGTGAWLWALLRFRRGDVL